MKFDVVVGNPPYQENDNGKRDDGSTNASASPLYHYFFLFVKTISNEQTCLIFPARWIFGSGKGLQKFTNDMLQDFKIKNLTLFQNSEKVFPNTIIKGGVLYITYDKNYEGTTEVTVIDRQDKTHKFNTYLNSADSGVFIPFKELINIYKKVLQKVDLHQENFTDIVSSRKPYGLSTNFFKNPSKFEFPPIFDTRKFDSDIEIIGLENKKRITKYAPCDYPVPKGNDTIYKWKLFAGKATGSGIFGEKIPDLPIGKPGAISTETFIRIGSFDSEYEVKAIKRYYHSKFFRALLGIAKTTQDASSRVYRFIPLQNFTKNSDINWDKSISEIDQQLYLKYNLSESEINFIEEKVKSMDDI